MALGLMAWLILPTHAAGQSGSISGSVIAPGPVGTQAIVYLTAAGQEATDPATGEGGEAVIDQRNLRFLPQVVLVSPGQEVTFLNNDPLLHNVFSPGVGDDGFDLGTYPIGQSRTHVFRQAGVHVILCHIHPEMEAYVIVAPALYHTRVDENGRFRLSDVPEGTYTLYVWHPRADLIRREATVKAGATLDLRIRLERRGGVRDGAAAEGPLD